MSDEIGWLIETPAGKYKKPLWFSTGHHVLTDDSTKALRFARREDAENMLEWLLNLRDRDGRRLGFMFAKDCYVITEHMWCDQPASPHP